MTFMGWLFCRVIQIDSCYLGWQNRELLGNWLLPVSQPYNNLNENAVSFARGTEGFKYWSSELFSLCIRKKGNWQSSSNSNGKLVDKSKLSKRN